MSFTKISTRQNRNTNAKQIQIPKEEKNTYTKKVKKTKQNKGGAAKAVNVIYKDIKMPASSLAAPAFQFPGGEKFKFSKHFYSLQTFVTCIQW